MIDAAIIFALGMEANGLIDRMKNARQIKAAGFSVWQGELKRQSRMVVVAGVGRGKAARATDAIIVAHRPRMIVSAGFAGGLDPAINRHAIVVANSIACEDGETINVPIANVAIAGDKVGSSKVHNGRLLTVDRIIRTPSEKLALGKKFEALAVDMESHAVATVCRQANVAFMGVRVVSDPADEELPRDLHKLISQRSLAGQAGAVLGSIFRRPSSVKDMFHLHQMALEASDRLADFLEAN